MKHPSSKKTLDSPPTLPPQEEWSRDEDDALWDILDKASQPEPSPFFARNVVRATRQLPQKESFPSRLRAWLSPPRLALGAGACALLFATYSMWFTPHSPTPTSSVADAQDQVEETQLSNFLADLVIEESLNAAAEDPTLFTHDEIIAMVGL